MNDNTGGGRAWQFLKRNPRFIVEWWMVAAGTGERPGTGKDPGAPPAPGAPFPVRRRTPADEAAAAWGLLAWEDPLREDGPASPFWLDAPTPEAVPSRGNAVFRELLETPGVRLSGVRIDSGPLILKVERGDAALQLLIRDPEALDIGGGFSILVPVPESLDLRVPLRGAADLWPLGGAGAGRGACGCRTGSFCSRSTCTRRAGVRARSAWRFAAGTGRSGREPGPTASCARSRGGGSRRPSG